MSCHPLRVVCTLALIGSCVQISCRNTQMVGAATQVTGGQMLKTSGSGVVEQQMLFDLQGLTVDPGDFTRNGGFGEPGSMFTLQYIDGPSKVRTTTYPFAFSPTTIPTTPRAAGAAPAPAGPMTGDQFVATIGALLQRIDRLAAEQVRSELALAEAKSRANSPEARAESLAKLVKELDLSEEQSDLLKELLETLSPSKGAQPSTASDPVAAAETAAQSARSALGTALTDLDAALASGRNYIIFRWKEERKGSANIAASDRATFKGTEQRLQTGFGIAAGIRRARLLLGTDLDAQHRAVDPEDSLVSWLESPYSTTGIVTETLQAASIQYYTRGEFDRMLELVLSASAKDLKGLITPENLMNLKVTVSLMDRTLSSYENRGLLSNPSVATSALEWGSFAGGAGWTTLASVSTTLHYLKDIERLSR